MPMDNDRLVDSIFRTNTNIEDFFYIYKSPLPKFIKFIINDENTAKYYYSAKKIDQLKSAKFI